MCNSQRKMVKTESCSTSQKARVQTLRDSLLDAHCRRFNRRVATHSSVQYIDGCSHSYSRRYSLQRHITSVHGDEHVVSTTAKRFTCHIRSREESFYHASRLTQHYKMKHNINISKLIQSLKNTSCIMKCQYRH